MKILAFETSCDDTSIALFEDERLISMHTKSQIKIHNKTGGVVPEVASREHANVIFEVLDQVLSEGNIELTDIDYIGVTTHPGLIPSLLTGITVASTISQTLGIPIIPIDHIEAHIFSNFLERPDPNSPPLNPPLSREEVIQFPLVCLTVSGGHNEIWYLENMWQKEKLGQTQDDAAGEAYDKVAKMMGLEYPGGPIISKLADEYIQEKISTDATHPQPLSGKKREEKQPLSLEKGEDSGESCKRVSIYKKQGLFPRVYLEKSELGFSFSGLKSAVKREVDRRNILSLNGGGDVTEGQRGLSLTDQQEISYEFQNAVNEVLTYKILEAAKQKGVTTILLAGGVSANDDLREKIQTECNTLGYQFISPTKKIYCMDNAAMIGILTYYRVKYEKFEEKIGTVQIGKW